MNRIILIGNGFDLAHGMETSYKQFIDNYWEKCIKETRKISINTKYENDEIIIKKRPTVSIPSNNYKEFSNGLNSHNKPILFKNQFLKIITEKVGLQNWVDIENEYYFLLKKTLNNPNSYPYYSDVTKLNSDFESIKNMLIEYLKDIETSFNKNLDVKNSKTKEIIGQKIYSPFKLMDFSESLLKMRAEIEYNSIKKDIEALEKDMISMEELNENKRKLITKINTKNPLKEIKKILKSGLAHDYFDLIPDQTIFLSFNYTFTEKLYSNPIEFEQFNKNKFSTVKTIHIHGTTDEMDNNPPIFGFGDEIDEDYKSIEKLNDNNYLQNIKSINYLETDNYKKLLEHINSGRFQIFIFGHSCGVSDRTLLNTIFEHENCASIKLFYYEKELKNDNYSDIVRNISRNFNDKTIMRDRVVNKTYSEKIC